MGLRKGILVAMYSKSLFIVAISIELFYNESVMEINPAVHLIQEKMRKLLYHSLEQQERFLEELPDIPKDFSYLCYMQRH